ncbi:choline transporter-like 2 isoform X2 [Rhynchophorus ferrugineus]|uniref:choline transporter-like 2 isoform X2 n=1 Tax=Rhynchophorus ferrugineus TaxID=354439 RepID=UPI003FCC6654
MGRKTAPEPRGELHDEPEYQGPIKNRSCTDIICLLLFLAFLVAWVGLGVWAIQRGDLKLLAVPTDSNGLRCGIDEEVKNKSYLFFFDISKCFSIATPFSGCDTPQICVSSCPKTTYIEGKNDISEAEPFCNPKDKTECPKWFVNSEPVIRRCLYNVAYIKQVKTNVDENLLEVETFMNPAHLWMTLLFHQGLSKITNDEKAHQIGQQIITDIVNSWKEMLIGIGMAIVCCLIYIFMLRWIAGIMVWFSIAAVVAGLSVALYFVSTLYMKWRDDFRNTLVSSSKTKRDIFLVLIIAVAIVLAIILLVLIFLRKRIVMAIALVKEGSKAVGSVTSVLFFPIVPWIFQFGIIAYTICTGAYLMTTGEPIYRIRTNGTCTISNKECEPGKTVDYDPDCPNATCKYIGLANQNYYPYFQAYNIFGFFWLAFFMSAFGQLVMAEVFARWFWTKNKSKLPFFAVTSACFIAVRYHLGTIAFGSLIIAICRIIRLCLEYIDRKLKKYDNEFTKAILCCLKCFFWCLEKFLKFINKNAYIMCAIHGKNFCSSAKDAFSLLVRNLVRVFVLDKITDFLFFISKVLVTLGVGAVAYVVFASDIVNFVDKTKIQYGVVPVIIIMIATYLIATLFFNVYSMAVDTLFLCFLEDIENNNGKDKPYFMPRSLMKIFGKKNKTAKVD